VASNEYDQIAEQIYAPKEKTEEDAIVDDYRSQQKTAMQGSLYAASKQNPDQYAKVMELSNQMKLPTDIVARNYDKLSKQNVSQNTDYDDMLSKNPSLSKWIQNKDNASLTHDDLDALRKVDSATQTFKSAGEVPFELPIVGSPTALGRAAQTGFNDLSAGLWHLGMSVGTAEQSDDNFENIAEFNRRSMDLRKKAPQYAQEFQKIMSEQGEDVNKAFKQFTQSYSDLKQGHVLDALKNYNVGALKTIGESLDYIASGIVRPKALVHSAVQSLAHSAPSLATGYLGAQAGGAIGTFAFPGIGTVGGAGAGFVAGSFAGASVSEVGSWINQELQSRGYDVTDAQSIKKAYSDPSLMADIRAEATRKGLVTAAVDSLFNRFAGKFLGASKGKSLVSKVAAGAQEIGVQATGEFASEYAGQVAAKKGVEGTNFAEALNEGITSFGHSIGEAIITSPIKARESYKKDTVQATEQVLDKANRSVEAINSASSISKIAEAVVESKTHARSPDAIRSLIKTALGDGDAASVFFQANEWDDYWNVKGVNPAEAAASIMGDDGVSYLQAKKNGSAFSIDTGAYISKLAGSEDFDGVLNITRAKPDGMTLGESKQFLSELPGLMGTLATEAQTYVKEEEQAPVRDMVTQQLVDVGFDQKTAETYGSLYQAVFGSIGEKSGKDALELFNKYGLKIQRPDLQTTPEGKTFEQSDLEVQKIYNAKRKEFTDFLQSKGKPLIRDQFLNPRDFEKLGAPPEMIERLKQFNRPENQPRQYPNVFKGVTYNQEVSPTGFYSALQAEIEKINFKEMPAKDLKAKISSLPGVKKIEIELSGLNDFLSLIDGKVSKEQVLNFLKENGIEIDVSVASADFRPGRKDKKEGQIFVEDLDISTEYPEPTEQELKSQASMYIDSGIFDEEDFSEVEDELRDEIINSVDEAKFYKEDEDGEKEFDQEGFDAEVDRVFNLPENQQEFEKRKTKYLEEKSLEYAHEYFDTEGNGVKIVDDTSGYYLHWNRNEDRKSIHTSDGAQVDEIDYRQRIRDEAAAQSLFIEWLVDNGIVSNERPPIKEGDLEWSKPKYFYGTENNKVIKEETKKLLESEEAKEAIKRRAEVSEQNDPGFEALPAEEKNRRIQNAMEFYAQSDVEDSFKRGELAGTSGIMKIGNDGFEDNSISGTNGSPGFTLETSDGTVFNLEATTFEAAKTEVIAHLKEKGIIAKEEAAVAVVDEPVDPFKPTEKTSWESRTSGDTRTNHREIKMRLPKHKGSTFAYPIHFKDKNYFAHLRLSDLEKDGKRLLAGQEFQSDWQQQARHRGTESGRDKAEEKLKEIKLKYRTLGESLELDLPRIDSAMDVESLPPEALELKKQYDEQAKEVEMFDEAVPDFPLGDSGVVNEMIIKQFLFLAAKENYDGVAIIPGEVHSARWGSERIAWKKTEEGFLVSIDSQVGGQIAGQTRTIEELAEERGLLIKKDSVLVKDKKDFENLMTDAIRNPDGKFQLRALINSTWKDMQTKEEGTKLPRKEGLEYFYNKILSDSVLKDIIKKVDKSAKIEFVEIENKTGDVSDVLEKLRTPVVYFSEEAKAKILKGQSYFQKNINEARGSITFGKQSININLFEKANLSTFLHESGHFFLEVYGDLVESGDANDKIKQDYTTLLKWFGVATRSEITVEHHEKMARGFEAYLMEGRAPTVELRSAFASFRAWLSAIYRSIKNLNVELSDEVRSVFDRMLATDEELAKAQEELNLYPLFSDPKAVGMTDAEAARYAKAIEEAKRASREQLDTKLIKAANKERGEMWKNEKALLVSQIREEVNKNMVHLARAVLQKGKNPDGTEAQAGLKDLKLNKQALVDEYGKDYLKKLPKPYMYSEDGVNHNTVAEIFGFSSGDEMLTQIINTPKTEDYINAKADAMMREKYGNPMFDEKQLEAAALAAAHTDYSAALMRKELEILARNNMPEVKGMIRKLTKAIPENDTIRAEAEKEIASKRYRDISPGAYSRAEARYSKEAGEAFSKGDFAGAFEAKRKQLLNHSLFKAAQKAKEKADSQADYMKSFLKLDKRKKLGLAGKEYLDQVDSLLERFDFAKSASLSSIDKRESLADFIRRQEENGTVPVIPDRIRNEAYKTSYKNLTINELQGLHDSVKNITALARLKNKLLKNETNRNLNEAVDEAVASIDENSKGKRKKTIETRRPEDELTRLGAGFLADHRKLASYMREFDGFKDNGVMFNLITRPINEAANKETEMIEAATIELNKIFDIYSQKERFDFGKKTYIPEIETSLSKEAMLVVAFNWGNPDNQQKIMDGYGWSKEQVEAILGMLDDKDGDFLNSIFAYIDTFWPEIKAMSERVDGVAPEKVEGAAFKLKSGKEIIGGYYPIKYDERQEPRAYANLAKEAAKQSMQGASVRASTRSGHRKERVAGVEMPIRLDLGVAFEHVSTVAHDLSHYEMLIDMNRILGSKRLQSAIIQNYGDIAYGQIRDAISDIAAGNVPAQMTTEKVYNRLRAGVSISAMGWNLMTTMQQPLGLTQSIFRVGPKWVGLGLKKWIGDAFRMQSTVEVVHEKSSFMRLRHKTQQREIAEIRNKLTDSKFKTDVYESFFYLIGKGQMIADIPTWMGAYEKAVAEQVDKALSPEQQEKQAIALADQAVIDSQGSGHIKDLAQIQRGSPFFKIWTSFYSYFSVTYNLNVEAFGKTNFRRPESIGRLGVDLLIINSLPALLTTIVSAGLRGDAEDPEKLAKKIAADQLNYLMGQMIGVREIGSAMAGYQGYQGPAGTRFFSEFGKLGKQASQGEVDEALIRSLNQVGGILFQYPATQVDKTFRGIDALRRGKTKNPAAVLFGPPPKK
jgi:hypothetical protein